MFKKLLSAVLTGLLISTMTAVPVPAQSQTANEPQQAEKIKRKVTKLGTGKRARVEVTLRDNTKLKGYIGEIGVEHFTVINSKQGTVTPISYGQVEKIKNTNHSDLYALGFLAGTLAGVMILVFTSLRGS